MKKTILIIAITIVATSLLWVVVNKASSNGKENKYFVDYEQSIIGKWIPVEEGDFNLEFTKYGIMKWKLGAFKETFEAIDSNRENDVLSSIATFIDDILEIELPYSVDGRLLTFRDDESAEDLEVKIKIYVEDGVEYLEIYNITKLAGKYKKVVDEK